MSPLRLLSLVLLVTLLAMSSASPEPETDAGVQVQMSKSPVDKDDVPYYLTLRPALIDLLRAAYLRPLYQRPQGQLGYRVRRKFPEVDSKGFDSEIFDEGFGSFSTMKRDADRRQL